MTLHGRNTELLEWAKKCRERFGETNWGQYEMVEKFTHQPNKYCSVGLIREVILDGPDSVLLRIDGYDWVSEIDQKTRETYIAMVEAFARNIPVPTPPVELVSYKAESVAICWNDSRERTREDVEDVWDRVIAELGGHPYPDSGRTTKPSQASTADTGTGGVA